MGRRKKQPPPLTADTKNNPVLQTLENLSAQTAAFSDTDHKILDEICNQIVPAPQKKTPTETVTDENVKQYVYAKTAELIESTMNIITSLQQTLTNTAANPKEILALSALIKSAASALKNMNDVNLQIRQSETQKDIKQMEIEAGIALSKNNMLPRPTTNVTNNYVIATREEMMDKLLEKIRNGSTPRATLEIQNTPALDDESDV